MSSTRRPKWHPPPPPSPRILHLPRRTRRRATTRQLKGKSISIKESDSRLNKYATLENLLDQERAFYPTVPVVILNTGDRETRERVDDFEYTERMDNRRCSRDFEDEKWKLQAEILRAECNFLRMEREVAMKKLEKNRVQMEHTLRSAVESLISGKKKMYEGKSVGVMLEEEIKDLKEKLEELQRSSCIKDFEFRKCTNFDKQTTVLQRRLEKLDGISEEECVKEIREMAEASLTISKNYRTEECFVSDRKSRFADVENLRRKMEVLSKGMLERMEEEYRSILSTTTTATASASSSAASSASTSRRIEFPDSSSSSSITRQQFPQETMFGEKGCTGRCRAIVRKIVEQVRAETEQWSEMQEMLGQVREEMEELRASRDFWEDRALSSDERIHSLQSAVHEWRHKAKSAETKVAELQKQICDLSAELERLKTEQKVEPPKIKGLAPLPLLIQMERERERERGREREKEKEREREKEKEKRVLICRLKENHQNGCNVNKQNEGLDEIQRRGRACSGGFIAAKRPPLRDIGNSSPILRQNSKAVFPLYSPESLPSEKDFELLRIKE